MLAIAMAMGFATMPGQTVLVTLWKEPARAELGLSALQVAGAYTLATILAGLPLPWVGRLADRVGVRSTVIAIALAFTLSLALIPVIARDLLTLGLCFFLVRFLGQGALGMLSGHTIAMWFERRLGVAHSLLAVLGFAAGSALLPAPVAWSLEHLGWEITLIGLAWLVGVLTLPAALFAFRNKPEDIGQHLDGDPQDHATHDVLHGGPAPVDDPAFTLAQALATRAYWILVSFGVATGLIGTALLFHMSDMLAQSGLEGTETQAAEAIIPWPICFGLAMLLVGRLADRFSPRALLPYGAGLMGGATLICLLATDGVFSAPRTIMLMGIGMGLYGASQAVIVGVVNPAYARFFGRTHHGSIRGTVATTMVVGTGIGPFAIAAVAELFGGSFVVPYAICALSAIPLGIAALLVRPPKPPPDPDRSPEHDEPDPAGPVM